MNKQDIRIQSENAMKSTQLVSKVVLLSAFVLRPHLLVAEDDLDKGLITQQSATLGKTCATTIAQARPDWDQEVIASLEAAVAAAFRENLRQPLSEQDMVALQRSFSEQLVEIPTHLTGSGLELQQKRMEWEIQAYCRRPPLTAEQEAVLNAQIDLLAQTFDQILRTHYAQVRPPELDTLVRDVKVQLLAWRANVLYPGLKVPWREPQVQNLAAALSQIGSQFVQAYQEELDAEMSQTERQVQLGEQAKALKSLCLSFLREAAVTPLRPPELVELMDRVHQEQAEEAERSWAEKQQAQREANEQGIILSLTEQQLQGEEMLLFVLGQAFWLLALAANNPAVWLY